MKTPLQVTEIAVAPTEVSPKRKRNRYTAKEKLEILAEADACTKIGEIGALLRRKGIYSSSLTDWRKARKLGTLTALSPKKRGPVAKLPSAAERENVELKKELAQTNAKLKRAVALIELQKKISELVGVQQPPWNEER